MTRKRWLLPACVLIGAAAITPAYVRVYRVAGFSDAPTFLAGDLILVSKAAYDVRLPYTDAVVISHSRPRPGDVVMFRPPGQRYAVFKRVVGCPGDTVVVRGGRLEINGVPLRYERLDARDYEPAARSNRLGALIEEEAGNGPPHPITRTPDTLSRAPVAAARVGDAQYYLVGDNRDHSRDSRTYGAVPRASILGKVVRSFRSVP